MKALVNILTIALISKEQVSLSVAITTTKKGKRSLKLEL